MPTLPKSTAGIEKRDVSGLDATGRRRHHQCMANGIENLVLEHLRAIRADISEMKLKIDELAGSYAGLLKIAASQGDAIVRLDRRIERIEKRLGLVEA